MSLYLSCEVSSALLHVVLPGFSSHLFGDYSRLQRRKRVLSMESTQFSLQSMGVAH